MAALRFPTTRWTAILAERDSPRGKQALLEDLLGAYWRPVYVYMRAKGLSPEDARDAVQGLFVRLLERDFLRRLDPAKGRLRSYLRAAAAHYIANLYAHERAGRRGGGAPLLSLDVDAAERVLASSTAAPDVLYEREWALSRVERALARLRAEFESGARRGDADTLLRFFGFEALPSYAEAAAAGGMSVVQFKAALHRARRRFRELLREEVGATAGPAAVEAELADVMRALVA